MVSKQDGQAHRAGAGAANGGYGLVQKRLQALTSSACRKRCTALASPQGHAATVGSLQSGRKWGKLSQWRGYVLIAKTAPIL